MIGKYYDSISNHPAWKGQVTPIDGSAAVKKLAPKFNGPMDGWIGYHNKLAGYGQAANALEAVHKEAVRLGVKFQLGQSDGQVQSILYSSAPRGTQAMRAVGVRTASGKVHLGQKVIVAMGSNVLNLLPSMSNMVTGRSWGVAHIQLTPAESEALRGIPVTQVRDLAFFFEPDRATNKLKFCHMGGGFTNYSHTNDGYSVPFDKFEDSGFLPANDEVMIRRLLQEVLPRLADRPLIDQHLCWMADSDDSDYTIDFVPGTDHSVVVLSGDSGHGFKMMPIFGSFVTDLLQAGLQSQPKWRWKQGARVQGSNWRASPSAEIASVPRAKL